MDRNSHKNKIDEEDNNFEELQFKYNFINTPWDDRSKPSKIGIVSLLVAIFAATIALVINNFVMHYRNFGPSNKRNTAIGCLTAIMEDYQFVANINSESTANLLCVGAVVSDTSVLASGVCAQSGVVRVHVGSHKGDCSKDGFLIKIIEPIYHDGIVSKKLVLLSTHERLTNCSKPISIGRVLNWDAKATVIGRPHRIGISLSRQLVSLVKWQYQYLGSSIKHLNKDNMICVKYLSKCPVRAGDLLLQKGRLFGIAATSVQWSDRNQLACFADLDIVKRELKELDGDIDIGRARNETHRTGKL